MTIDSLLAPYQRFGVNLGLKRIQQLLSTLGNPHQQVPIIHVGGTNGKGSVCAYLAAVLKESGYKVGRYTSPHLVDWTERICLNNVPIPTSEFEELLVKINRVTAEFLEKPTLFEVVTAAAWLYFAQQKVDIAVMEVGLGGRLDATNVVDSPLVSVITSISREHWQVLGDTVGKIASEKAGILKKGCSAVIGKLPLEAEEVIAKRMQELDCPGVWVQPAQVLREENKLRWVVYEEIEYPLPLLGDVQLSNSAIAIATLQILQQQGWQIPLESIQAGMGKTQWLGRLQWYPWHNQNILIDGAHNPAAALGLRQYVDSLDTPVTWVMGMLSTKEHRQILQILLRSGDTLALVPVPNHSSADLHQLLILAQEVCPDLEAANMYDNVFTALEIALEQDKLIALCGSLYLIGHFFS